MPEFRAVALLTAAVVLLVATSGRGVEKSNWVLDPARTRIDFTIDAVGFPRTKGQFHTFDGKLSVDFEHPERGHVAFVVNTASVDVGSPAFNGTLRGVAFLDTTRFPEIRFESTAVRKLDESHVRVTGDLKMLGVKLPLPVDVDVERAPGDTRLGFTARARIDRLAWGMNSGYPIISREVELEVKSEAVAK